MKNKLFITCICILGCTTLFSQKNTVSAGGNNIGPGGSFCYSVGQINYTFQTNGNENIIEGLQQPYEISVLEIKNFETLSNITVFPNPTTQFVTISVKEFENIEYQLFDTNGRLIQSGKIVNAETTINVSRLPQATFILNIIKNQNISKTYKIIKKD